jgi:hypothetical protein
MLGDGAGNAFQRVAEARLRQHLSREKGKGGKGKRGKGKRGQACFRLADERSFESEKMPVPFSLVPFSP